MPPPGQMRGSRPHVQAYTSQRKEYRTHGLRSRNIRYRGHRRGPRGHRGCAGRRPAGAGHPVLHGEPGRGGQHALQPGHRRHGEGPPGAGAGRPGGRDGKGRRPGVHPVPALKPGQGPSGVVAAGPGRPPPVPGDHEAHPGAAGAPVGEAGGDHRRVRGTRPGRRRAHRLRGGVPGQGRGGGHRHLPGGPHHRGGRDAAVRPRRAGRRPPPDGEPGEAGAGAAAVQDRHAPPGQRPQRGLLPDGAAGGGRAGAPLLL